MVEVTQLEWKTDRKVQGSKGEGWNERMRQPHDKLESGSLKKKKSV